MLSHKLLLAVHHYLTNKNEIKSQLLVDELEAQKKAEQERRRKEGG